MPNGEHITSTHTAELPIPALPPAATQAHLFPNLAANALISVGVLCDNGCEALFSATKVFITLHGKIVMEGQRQAPGLWYVDLDNPTPNETQAASINNNAATATANSIIDANTQRDLMQFLHAAAFSPVTSTFTQAIDKGFFTSWPGLTSKAVRTHLPKSMATAQGHLDQTRKNLQSTKPTDKTSNSEHDDAFQPTPAITDGLRTHYIYAAIVDSEDTTTGQIFSDLTGRFPTTSSKGNRYTLIIYEYDSNAILAEAMKNRSDAEALRAYAVIIKLLISRGLRPKLQRLDNEASEALKQYLGEEQGIEYQLAPPGMHRRNAAERAIRTFKNHLIAGLCSCDPTFPMHLWCRLLQQAIITLNLLRASRINPKLSAYAQVFGNFDYNRTPLAPPGTRVLSHDKPDKRASWAPHGEEGWYVGPAMEHYRCYRIFIIKTKADRDSDTVTFFPSKTRMPALSSTDRAIRAANELVHALRNPHPASPLVPIGTEELQALEQLSEIFGNAVPRVDTGTGDKPALRQPQVNDSKIHAMQTRQETRNQQPAPRVEHMSNQATLQPPKAPAPPPSITQLRADLHNVVNTQPMPTSTMEWTNFMHVANAVLHPDTGQPMEYRELIRHPKTTADWLISSANEFGRLAQGVRDIPGTDTIFFIQRHEIPAERQHNVTYLRFVCDVRPQKAERNRTRVTVGGNLIDYPGDVSTRTADLTTVKCMANSIVSTKNGKGMACDLKNYYLGTVMERHEYAKVHIGLIPPEIVEQYNLKDIQDSKGYIYIRIEKGMYGLPQSGILANQLLAKRLARHGYYQTRHTPGLWKHIIRPLHFVLVVDDFFIQYTSKVDAQHLMAALKQDYEVTIDWEAKLYCGITFDWDYDKGTVDLSMPGYVDAALQRFQHQKPNKPEYQPYRHNVPQYGKTVQYVEEEDTSRTLTKDEVTRVQQVVGTFLFYGRAVDPTTLVALSTIASQQSCATAKTMEAVNKFLDYMATNSMATTRFQASDMVVKIHSDASYLTERKARSRSGGHFYLGNKPDKPEVINQGGILEQTGIMRNVMSSAAEAEICAQFINEKEGTIIRITLDELGWPQAATPVRLDNSTSYGLATNTITQKRSRAIDMRFYWIQDREEQGQFISSWAPAALNKGDYQTKHHSAAHHKAMRPIFLYIPPKNITT